MLQLYDLAGLYFRAFYALPSSIRGPHGRPVNAIRGTVDMLAGVIAAAAPARAVACLDVDWRPAWRVALIPSYKTHRVLAGSPDAEVTGSSAPAGSPAAPAAGSEPDGAEAVPDELSWQVPVILDVLGAVGISLGGAADCEADDVIGTLADRERRDAVEIVTGDRDLFQLIRDEPTPVTVRYVGGGMGKAGVMGPPMLAERYGVDGPGYAAMATLRGDPSDGLPGVPGIGEKTAARLVADFGSIPQIVAAAGDPASPMSPTTRRRITDAAEYLRAAVPVVAVRRDAAVELDSPSGDDVLPRTPANADRLEELAAEHGIGSVVERLVAALAGR